MHTRSKARLFVLGVIFVLILGIVACGEAATPAPTAAPPPPQPTPDIAALVSGAVSQALDAQAPTGLTAQEIQDLVTGSIAATIVPGASAADVQAAVTAAVGAVEPGVSAADVQGQILKALTALAAAATPVPTAAPAPAPAPAPAVPTGTLDVGVLELGPGVHLPSRQPLATNKFDIVVTHEAMFQLSPEGAHDPMVIESWSVDAAGTGYTFNIQKGIQFQRGYGELTADDLIWTIDEVIREGSVHPSSSGSRRFFRCDGCSIDKIDSHTVKVTRPSPSFQATWWSLAPRGGTGFTLHSKLQYETLGEEGAASESVGTGPWQLTEASDSEFNKVKAVQGHWSKTPEWAEMIWWEIPEESTRVANFLVGRLDTGAFSTESIQAIKKENQTGVEYMSFPGAYGQEIRLGGSQYNADHPAHQPGEDGAAPRVKLHENAYDCTVAWVSCDRDVNSDEWGKALKVRLAMTHAIDRDALINNLAFGDGVPQYISFFTGHTARLKEFGMDKLVREYDPALAKTLLKEAGYEGGFDIPVTLTPAFLPGAPEAGEAVSNMWEAVGINPVIEKLPYSTFRPKVLNRSHKSAWFWNNTASISPFQSYSFLFGSANFLNIGFEHPDFQELMETARVTYDVEKQWPILADMGKFIYDNVLHIPLFEQSSVWPIGPELGRWDPMAQELSLLSRWQYAPHR